MNERSEDTGDGGAIGVLITANQAYPRLEQLFLDAQHSIRMGFRLFDPTTRLQSEQARAIGVTWYDLLRHTLNRGVVIDLTVSDFDPVMANDMHVQAWGFVRRYIALNEQTGPGAGRMTVRCLLHPAEGGLAPRLMFCFRTRSELSAVVKGLNQRADPARALERVPGIREWVRVKDGRINVRPFALPRVYPATLHHKVAVIDGKVTYLGGLDLNNRRIDDTDHDRPAKDTWHDVQLVLPDARIAGAAERFLAEMHDVTGGRVAPAPGQPPFLRTLSRRRRLNRFSLSPKTLTAEILAAHLVQIRRAETLIYLESQYFRDRRIARALVHAARRAPNLGLLVMLPAAPDDVAFRRRPGLDARFGEYLQARAIRKVRKAFGDRFLVLSPAQPRAASAEDRAQGRATLHGAPIVYVHSKVSIFDDRAAIVSSANLNGRSLKWDSEAGIFLDDQDSISRLRQAVFGAWLTPDAGPEFHDPQTAFAAWTARTRENAARPPHQRIGYVLPYAVQPGWQLAQPIPGAPEEMV